MSKEKVLIIGAGPAGLTAAYELAKTENYEITIIEQLSQVGGISRTINYKNNRMDIGGHRFFSKSEWVMNWWQTFMPTNDENTPIADQHEKSMLIRPRLSRIYYLRKFFNYPIQANTKTAKALGLRKILKILIGYAKIKINPIKNERNLEEFFINRFGDELYKTFFKDYTEKVWGVPCSKISSEWGAQRIKGLSIRKTLSHALKKKNKDVRQKQTETSLIEKFLYPKLGPGQLWEIVSEKLKGMGVEIVFEHSCKEVQISANKAIAAVIEENIAKQSFTIQCDYFISTMPIQDLFEAISPPPPADVMEIAKGLVYRDFITIGVLIEKNEELEEIKDNWIYIQEPDVKLGRLQIFNNWSPALVENPKNLWLGLEYFCQENDDFWKLSDNEIAELAIQELKKIEILKSQKVLDHHVVRIPKAYPAYFGSYARFQKIIDHSKTITNLYLVGRNGMHKYNNQDHSMLTAKEAAKNIITKNNNKENIWNINTEEEYHESKNA